MSEIAYFKQILRENKPSLRRIRVPIVKGE